MERTDTCVEFWYAGMFIAHLVRIKRMPGWASHCRDDTLLKLAWKMCEWMICIL